MTNRSVARRSRRCMQEEARMRKRRGVKSEDNMKVSEEEAGMGMKRKEYEMDREENIRLGGRQRSKYRRKIGREKM